MLKCFFNDFVELAIQIRVSRMVVLVMPFCKPGAVQIALRYESSRVVLYIDVLCDFFEPDMLLRVEDERAYLLRGEFLLFAESQK